MSDPIATELGESWKPPALREAEAQLEETMAKSRELIKQVEEKLKAMPDESDHKAKPEDVTAMKAAAAKPDAPAPLRELKKKVDAGELTWEDVLEGKALKDETVREVMAGRLGEMREIYEEVQEGATLDDILEARGVSSGSVFNSGGSSTYTQSAPAAPPSEDDYFSGGHVLSGQQPAQPTQPPTPPTPSEPPSGPRTPEPPRHSAAPPPRRPQFSDDEFDNPLASRGQAPEPPQRSSPQPRAREEYADDDFDNPLASRDRAPEQPEKPKPTSPPRNRRRRDDDGDDDDFYGGSILR